MHAKRGFANNKNGRKNRFNLEGGALAMKTNDNKAQQQKKAQEQKGSTVSGNPKLNGPDRPST